MTIDTQKLRDLMDKALGRAYSMGQTYWMQADSESYSQNRRSDETQAKFDAMRTETVAKFESLLDHIDAQAAEIARLREALAELVECKKIKQHIAIEQSTMIPESDEDLHALDRLMIDLAKRQPKAWEAADLALAQHQGEKHG